MKKDSLIKEGGSMKEVSLMKEDSLNEQNLTQQDDDFDCLEELDITELPQNKIRQTSRITLAAKQQLIKCLSGSYGKMNNKQISTHMGICMRTITRTRKEYNQTGDIKTCEEDGQHVRFIQKYNQECYFIRKITDQNKSITYKELQEQLLIQGYRIGRSSICARLKAMQVKLDDVTPFINYHKLRKAQKQRQTVSKQLLNVADQNMYFLGYTSFYIFSRNTNQCNTLNHSKNEELFDPIKVKQELIFIVTLSSRGVLGWSFRKGGVTAQILINHLKKVYETKLDNQKLLVFKCTKLLTNPTMLNYYRINKMKIKYMQESCFRINAVEMMLSQIKMKIIRDIIRNKVNKHQQVADLVNAQLSDARMVGESCREYFGTMRKNMSRVIKQIK